MIEVLNTGVMLNYDFIQQKLFDSSKNLLVEVVETELPTPPSPTAAPTPDWNPYP